VRGRLHARAGGCTRVATVPYSARNMRIHGA